MRLVHLGTACALCLAGVAVLKFAAGDEAKEPTREERVRDDRAKVEAEGFWIYNDLARGFAEAKETGKPLLVVFRCLPCVECVKLDDELVDRDPVVRPLLEKFVCVRQVSTNGIDLSLFQFDTDQSFACFMLNADQTIYGRFGTRSHHSEWLGDVSLPGLARALEGALELHAAYPRNADQLAKKRGPAVEIDRPELLAPYKGKYSDKLNYAGDVVASCIHCHMIGDARLDMARVSPEPLAEELLYPYPHPKLVGLILDPDERATVKSVSPDSFAAAAGFQARDRIVSLAGQPLLSMADVQWVLHHANPKGDMLRAVVERDGKTKTLTLSLPSEWRRGGDLGWRSSSWTLRRMTTGGLWLVELTPEERQAAGLAQGKLALRVRHAGQYGAHAAAFNAGIRNDDILVEFDGHGDLSRESDLFWLGMTEHKVGDQVSISVLRGGKRIKARIPMQE